MYVLSKVPTCVYLLGFIGFADLIYKLLSTATNIENMDDDQLFYTTCYLNKDIRETLRIKLDHKAEIFQNLYGASGKYSSVTLLSSTRDFSYCLVRRRCSSHP